MTDKAEQELETKLRDLGLTSAPRVTPAMVDAMIEHTEYIMLPGDSHMICKLRLFGGRFHVTGESSTVSRENFNDKIAEEISFRNAREKIWPLAGAILAYDLQQHRTPLPPEVLALPVDVQLVVVELNQVLSRLKALGPLVANEQALLESGAAQEEVDLLKQQFTFMSGYSETLQKRLARIGL